MGNSGSLTLAAAFALLTLVLLVAYRGHRLDRLAHRLSGRRPEARFDARHGGGHLRLLPPRSLPRGDLYGDCGLKDWDGGDAA